MEVAQPPVELVKTIGDGACSCAPTSTPCSTPRARWPRASSMKAGGSLRCAPASPLGRPWPASATGSHDRRPCQSIVDVASPGTIVVDVGAAEHSTRVSHRSRSAQEPQGHRRTEPAALPARPARRRGVLTGWASKSHSSDQLARGCLREPGSGLEPDTPPCHWPILAVLARHGRCARRRGCLRGPRDERSEL